MNWKIEDMTDENGHFKSDFKYPQLGYILQLMFWLEGEKTDMKLSMDENQRLYNLQELEKVVIEKFKDMKIGYKPKHQLGLKNSI